MYLNHPQGVQFAKIARCRANRAARCTSVFLHPSSSIIPGPKQFSGVVNCVLAASRTGRSQCPASNRQYIICGLTIVWRTRRILASPGAGPTGDLILWITCAGRPRLLYLPSHQFQQCCLQRVSSGTAQLKAGAILETSYQPKFFISSLMTHPVTSISV